MFAINKHIESYIKDKSILIIGFGLEGKSTYRFIRSLFPKKNIGICDKNKDSVTEYFKANSDSSISLYLGDDYLEKVDLRYDIAFKTPGIPISMIKDKIHNDTLITSQANLFMSYCKEKVIGITGTKGKSTTSTLIYNCLQAQGIRAALIGNIGKPPFDLLLDEIEYDWFVYELSSHQLDDISYSPHIAILLNIYEDHLDY